MKLISYLCLPVLIALCSGCAEKSTVTESDVIFDIGRYPFAIEHNGKYFYTMQNERCDSIILYSATEIADIASSPGKVIFTSSDRDMHNFYSPEIHRFDNRWYIYFEADDGNTDNHQIYVLENPAESPMAGEWTLHGPIITNSDWNFGIHPTTISVADRRYLLWSGWPKRRTESETQCIFIAEMADPWTLRSERVMISMPQYEWERQWINPDGSRSAYPIFVNENPEAFISPDGRNVVVCYSASGIWTIFNTIGMLYAPVGSDLLDPRSWTKLPEPQFTHDQESGIFGSSNITIVPSHDNTRHFLLYQAKHATPTDSIINDIRIREIAWSDRGLPLFTPL